MKEKSNAAVVMEKIVMVFVLGYGLHYLGYFLRIRYFNFLEATVSDEGVSHILMYLGHTIFLIIMLLYAWAVRKDRKYILSFSSGKLSRNLLFALYGAVFGFAMMGICVLPPPRTETL